MESASGSSVLSKFKQRLAKFSKRSLILVIFLAVILLGGIITLARGGNFNIFASQAVPGQGNFLVTAKKSGVTINVASVTFKNNTTSAFYPGMQLSDGRYNSGSIPTGSYSIYGGMPGSDGAICSGQVNETLSSDNQAVDLQISCNSNSTATPSPSPSSTSTPITSPSPLTTPSVATSTPVSSVTPIYGHTSDIEFQGKVSASNSPIAGAQIKIHCPASHSSYCASNNITEQAAYSGSGFQTTNNQAQNYRGSFKYNIAKAGAVINSLEGTFCAPSGFTLSDGDTCSTFAISKSDIQSPSNATGKSFLKKDFELIPSQDSSFDVVGMVGASFTNSAAPVFVPGIKLRVVREINGRTEKYETVTLGEEVESRTDEININYKIESIPFDEQQYRSGEAKYHLEVDFGEKLSLAPFMDQFLKKIDINFDEIEVGSQGVRYLVFGINESDGSVDSIHVNVTDPRMKPIEGAQVTLSSMSCKQFQPLIKKTSDIGTAFFDDEQMFWFGLYKETGMCLEYLELKVTANGYADKNITVYPDGREMNVTLNPLQNCAQKIKGRIIESDSDRGVSGATVFIWKNNPVGPPLKTVKSDSNGNYSFDMMNPGRYVVSTFHSDYLSTGLSRKYFELSSNSCVEADLVVKKITTLSLGENKINFPICAFELGTQKPLSGAKVKISNSNQTYETGSNGCTSSLQKEEQFNVELSYQSNQQARFIDLRKFSDLTDQQKTNLYKKGIFYFASSSSALISPLNIKVVDIKNKPISAATIEYTPPRIMWDLESSSLSLPGNILTQSALTALPEYLLRAQTNSSGLAKMPDDFKYFIPTGEQVDPTPQQKKTKFEIGEQVKLKVTINNITQDFTKQVSADGNIVLKFTNNSTNIAHKIKLSTIDLSSEQLGDRNELSNYSLEYKNGNSWEKIDLPSSYESEISYGTNVTSRNFSPRRKGLYRAAYQNSAYRSSEIYFDDSGDETIEVVSCLDTPQSRKLSYPGDINFIVNSKEYDDYLKKPNAKKIYDEVAAKLLQIKTQNDVGPIIVIWTKDSMGINAFAMNDKVSHCMGVQNARMIKFTSQFFSITSDTDFEYLISPVVAHEYGHLVFNKEREKNTEFYRKWVWLFKEIKQSPNRQCVFDRMKDGNIWSSYMAFGGHPDDDYDGRAPGDEMFASVFSSYFTFHDRLLDAIIANSSGGCKNDLAFLWTYFAENMGNYYPLDDKIFQPVGGSIGDTDYSFSQIESGSWRKEVYEELNLSQKINILYTRYISSLPKGASSVTIRARLAVLNTFADAASIGRPKGHVQGIVVDKAGRSQARQIVRIGNKFALTNSDGTFEIKNLTVIAGGTNISAVTDFESGGVYSILQPLDRKVYLSNNLTITITLKINR